MVENTAQAIHTYLLRSRQTLHGQILQLAATASFLKQLIEGLSNVERQQLGKVFHKLVREHQRRASEADISCTNLPLSQGEIAEYLVTPPELVESGLHA